MYIHANTLYMHMQIDCICTYMHSVHAPVNIQYRITSHTSGTCPLGSLSDTRIPLRPQGNPRTFYQMIFSWFWLSLNREWLRKEINHKTIMHIWFNPYPQSLHQGFQSKDWHLLDYRYRVRLFCANILDTQQHASHNTQNIINTSYMPYMQQHFMFTIRSVHMNAAYTCAELTGKQLDGNC